MQGNIEAYLMQNIWTSEINIPTYIQNNNNINLLKNLVGKKVDLSSSDRPIFWSKKMILTIVQKFEVWIQKSIVPTKNDYKQAFKKYVLIALTAFQVIKNI